jgi:hypothetical protein
MPTIGRLKFGDLILDGKINERIPHITEGLVAHFPFDNTVIGEDYNRKRNLLDITEWELGTSGDQGNFKTYAGNTNSIIKYPNPWNIKDSVWGGLANTGASDWQCGWNDAQIIPIDHTKLYRFTTWVKRDDMSTGSGKIIFTCKTNMVSNFGSSSQNALPYFMELDKAVMNPFNGEWLLLVGHVFPSNHPGFTKHPDSGVYDISGNKVYNIGNDYRWLPTTTVGGHGCFLHGSTDVNEKQYWYHPRMEIIDGYGNSIQELISDIEDKINPSVNSNTSIKTTGLSVCAATTNLASSVEYGIYSNVSAPVDYYAIPNPEDRISKKYMVTGSISPASGQKILPAVAGNTYNVSIIMKITGNGSILLNISKSYPETGNSISVTIDSSYSMDLGYGWYKKIVTYTINSNTTSSCILQFGISDGVINDEFYVHDLQWEQKSYATSYVDGTSSDGAFTIPKTMFPATGTILFEFMPRTFSPNDPIISSGIDAGFDLLMQSSATIPDSYWGIVADDMSAGVSGDWFPNLYVWYRIAIVYINSDHAILYINGEQVAFISIGNWYARFLTGGTGLCLGSGIRSTTSIEFRNLSIYNKALSPTELSNYYSPSSLKMQRDGSINMPLIEGPIGIPNDAFYWPLGANTLDKNYKFDASSNDNLVYKDGYVWVVTQQTQQFNHYSDTSLFPLKAGSDFTTMVFEDHEIVYKYTFNGESLAYRGVEPVLTANIPYFIKVEVFVSNDYNGNYDDFVRITQSTPSQTHKFNYDLNRKGAWQTYILKLTPSTTEAVSILMHPAINNSATKGHVLFKNFMITSTEYEVPFHKTILPKGNLKFNLNSEIGLDWSSDWSIIYWKIPKGTDLANLTGYSIETLGVSGNSVGGGYYWWGKKSGLDILSVSNINDLPIIPLEFFSNPHMISIVKSGSIITWKFWGIGGIVLTITENVTIGVQNYFVNQYGYDLQLGGWNSTSVCNTMFKDLIVLKRALDNSEVENLYKIQMRAKDGKLYTQGLVSDGYIF